VRRAGVPAATIHHYLKLGLLPNPRRSSSSRFLYDERHVQGLRLIRTLRDRRGLSLKVIRSMLPNLLGLEEDEAFRPEMWDRVVGQLAGRGRRTPAARLLDAAVDTFSRRGYGDVNVDDLCRAARMAKGSFYRHYRSKEELFFAAAQAAADDVVASFTQAAGLAPVAERRAEQVLAAVLEPRLAVFLDLFARAAQRRPGYAAAARRISSDLALRLGEGLGSADPEAEGRMLFQLALQRVLWEAIEPPLLPITRGAVATPL